MNQDQSILSQYDLGEDLIHDYVYSGDQRLDGLYNAVVTSEPSKNYVGYVKVRIMGITDGDSGIKDNDGLWAEPAPQISFRVPKIGTNVLIYFRDGDIYFPVYINQSTDQNSYLPEESIGDGSSYPKESVIYSDQSGFKMGVNSDNKTFTVNFPTGASIHVNEFGEWSFTNPTGVQSGDTFGVITEDSVNILTAKPMTKMGTPYMKVSSNSINPSRPST